MNSSNSLLRPLVSGRSGEWKLLRAGVLAAFAVLPFVLSENCFADDVSPEAVAPTARMELFNGKDFSGWTFFMRTNADPAKTWRVEDGLIKCTGQPFGYIRTEKDYRDYKLTVEWRFPQQGNSGVLIHMRGEDKLWPTSLECQGQT
ncbi:MAG TPA: DUF1080 domain-containing protein, partial [Verrucomicrobiota bacterium]|nr:DUF1080 domain-containing protein [Verrucomicrobiota bacterium]